MGLKLKEEPSNKVEKTGSDYINRDYEGMADTILNSENNIPESRYSTSNAYQTTNLDMARLNAGFEKERQDNPDTVFSKYANKHSSFRIFGNEDDGLDEVRAAYAPYIIIIICVIIMFVRFDSGMKALRELSKESVELECTIISVEYDEVYDRSRSFDKWVDQYTFTYEWVGENGEIQTGVRYSEEREFDEGDIATVTVLADNLNEEIDSKTTAKGKVASSFLFCVGAAAILAVCVIRLKKD